VEEVGGKEKEEEGKERRIRGERIKYNKIKIEIKIRERIKVEQERAKRIDIWTEWKREIGNSKQKMKRIKIKMLNKKNQFNEYSSDFKSKC
jgi:hypothetical protein